jgi:hypothetical protein
MNAVVGIAAAGQGGLAITAEIADRRVCAVRVSSTRPTHLSRLFIGRPAQEAPLLAGRIFSLCGVSHRVVAQRAIASARDTPVSIGRHREEELALTADRLGGMLRSNVILTLDSAASPDLGQLRAVGEMLSLSRDLSTEALARAEENSVDRQRTKALRQRLCALGRELGLSTTPKGEETAAPLAFESLHREFAVGEILAVGVPDALSEADDLEIMRRMRAEGASFAALPSLGAGRRRISRRERLSHASKRV